ncbi:MAG: hypothetical protein IJT05_09090 [Lachnospiraceae bacterium]|nr:hypothetical protein [Lachnospiraceae bacterium]
MRQEEFKMERLGLLKEGDVLSITESRLPGPDLYYYTLGEAFAMSGNYTPSERIFAREGKVLRVRETQKGYFVTVEVTE